MESTDDLDIRLLKEIARPASHRWDVVGSIASIAKKLSADEETIRRRLKHAQQRGLLKGFHLIPNPHLLGRDAAEIAAEVSDKAIKASVINQVGLLDDVILIVNFHGKAMHFLVYYEDDEALARKVELIRSLCRSKNKLEFWKDPFPIPKLRLRETDWRILHAMRKDGRKNLSEVAKEIQSSARTVRRRFVLMTKERAFFLLPLPNFDKLSILPCNFRIYSPDPEKKKWIDEQLRSALDKIVFSRTGGREYSIFTVICANLSEAEHTRKWISSLDGVKAVTSDFTKEIIPVTGWLDEQVSRRIGETRNLHTKYVD